jgi:hypothetical protein
MRAGALTAADADVLGTQTFADWLAERANGTSVSRP